MYLVKSIPSSEFESRILAAIVAGINSMKYLLVESMDFDICVCQSQGRAFKVRIGNMK